MAETTLKVTLKQKYDTDENWAKLNPILAAGEIAFSYDKDNDYKVGNGEDHWAALPYNAARFYSACTAITAGFCEKCRFDAQGQEINVTYIKNIEPTDNNQITITWGDDRTQDITVAATIDQMTGATSTADGAAGTVPAPLTGQQDLFLKGDGTWATPTDTTYEQADASTLGLVKLYTSTGENEDGAVTQKVLTDELSTKAESSHTHDSSDITSIDAGKISGVISIDNLPAAAVERCVVVSNDDARFALTTNDVQTGDTVKVSSTNLMYFVKDDTKLGNEGGYEVYTAGAAATVPWSGVTGKPDDYTPSAHNHSGEEITSGTISSDRLPASGVSAGTYASVTVDAKGRVTAGTNPSTAEGYGITDVYTKSEMVNLLDNKVSVSEGMGLSQESYTTDEKTKLAGIEASADVNVIETIQVNSSNLSVVDKTVNIAVPTTPADISAATSAQGALADTAVQTIKIGGVEQTKTSGSINLPAYPTTLPASDVTSTYDALGTAPVNGIAVAAAIASQASTTTTEITELVASKVLDSSEQPENQKPGDVWIEIL